MAKATAAAKEQAKRGPCTPAGETCPGMEMAIKAGGARGLGFRFASMMDFKTGAMSTSLVYYLPKKVEGASYLLVNVCPWCGERVVERPAPASSGSDAAKGGG